MMNSNTWQLLKHIPHGLLETTAKDLHQILDKPTLLHLPGRRQSSVFVSVLLHGNEDTGWQAMQQLLQHYQTHTLPRDLLLLIGNVDAAREGLRCLPEQPDYNRVWPGGSAADGPEQQMMQDITDYARQQNLAMSVDIHNNTGLNPHYACINQLEQRFFHLATLFSRTLVYFIKPIGVQSLAFAPLCPAVTIECGPVGTQFGIQHAQEFINACLHLNEWPDHPVAAHDMDLFHTVGVIKIPSSINFDVGNNASEVCFDADLDHLNFRELPINTPLATVHTEQRPVLEVWDEQGRECAADYFKVENQTLITCNTFMPSMFTLDTRIIRQDCLGYIMERLPHS